MFSRFNKGITGTKSDGVLDFPKLIKIIQNNPQRIEIEGIRQLRSDGNNEYKALKRQLPIITPNCLVHERSLEGENFNINFISFSQYIYFDFDIDMNVDDFKRYMVDKYKDKASLICISSSKGGISILFKVSNTLTKDNFLHAWIYIRDNILKVEKDMIDERCKNIGRVLHISYDPDVYYSYENEIELDLNTNSIINEDEYKTQSIYNHTYNRPSFTSEKITFNEALAHVNLKTQYTVSNSLVDLNPIPFAEVRFPRVITDGNKRRVFSGVMYTLKYLKPDIEFKYFYKVLQEINNNFAKPKMEGHELKRLCELHFDNITPDDLVDFPTRIKSVHFNQNAMLGAKEKNQIANFLNATKRKAVSIDKIIAAKKQLTDNCQEITKKGVERLTGLSYPTVLKYFDSPTIDLVEILKQINL